MSALATQIVEAMARAGCSIEQAAIVLADIDRQRAEARVRRRCERAIEAALFSVAATTPEAPVYPAKPANLEPAAVPASLYARARMGIERSAVLSRSEMQVALTLLDRRNGAAGLIDPGQQKLGKDSGTSERTVRRAMPKLAALGLVVVRPHAGAHHQHVYEVDLVKMAELVPLDVGRIKAVYPAKSVDQTGHPAKSGRQTKSQRFLDSSSGESQQRARKAKPRDMRQRELPIHGVIGGQQSAIMQGGRDRLMADIAREGRADPAFTTFGLSADDMAEATAAETRGRGAGLKLIKAMQARRPPPVPVPISDALRERLGTGPPRLAVSGTG